MMALNYMLFLSLKNITSCIMTLYDMYKIVMIIKLNFNLDCNLAVLFGPSLFWTIKNFSRFQLFERVKN